VYKDKRVLAIIPARKGSKRLRGKNMRILRGRSLVDWAIIHAKSVKYIDKIVVTTDIGDILRRKLEGVTISKRPYMLCLDDTKMGPVVKNVVQKYPGYDIVVLLQPTSPLRQYTDIEIAIRNFRGGLLKTVNEQGEDNGAVYVMSTKNVNFDLVADLQKMPDNRSVDVDTINDFEEAERLLA